MDPPLQPERSTDVQRRKGLGDLSSDFNLEIFWWIDWACTDQDAPGPDMAALPAYAAVSGGIVAAWDDVYAGRAWCQVELLMAYAFTASGKNVFVVPEGFKDGGTYPLLVKGGPLYRSPEKVTLADPAHGNLTNEGDRAVIQSLTDVASRSSMFTCWRTFVNESTTSLGQVGSPAFIRSPFCLVVSSSP